MKNILVTGSTGFIGKALSIQLNKTGYNVVKISRKNIQNSDFVVVENIGSSTQWQSLLVGIEYVIHLAARVHVMNDISSDPLQEFRSVNTEGTIQLAKSCVEAGVKRIIYLSSIKVNGEYTTDSAFQELDKVQPQDPYSVSKCEAEMALLKIAKESNLEVVIIRPPLVYGPGVKANFRNMMSWLNKGVPLPFGSIHNKRSLVALDNLIDLIVTCIDHPAASNQVFLVADNEDMSTTELLRRVSFALGVKSRLLPVNQRLLEVCLKLLDKKDLSHRLCGSLQVDISKAKKLLNWTPPVSVDKGLQKAAQHFLKI